MRYKLTLEYDGTSLIGWQENAQGPSVQSLLQEAIFKFCRQRVEVVAAGRTDAGVHALGMVCHFDLEVAERRAQSAGDDNNKIEDNSSKEAHSETPSLFVLRPSTSEKPSLCALRSATYCETIMRALNFYLMNSPIAVLGCEEVPDDFHARFSCVRRNYRYIILNRRAPAVLGKSMVWWIPRPLDLEKMRVAAERLVGNHDFTSFRASECQAKSPVKTLDSVNIRMTDDGWGMKSNSFIHHPSSIILDFSARSFLHHQVRNMVGTLVEIGLGKPYNIDEIFAAKNRSAAGPTSPASGLYFVTAEY